jgi:hypothetical protein
LFPDHPQLPEEERTQTFDPVWASLPADRVGRLTDMVHAVLELTNNGYTNRKVRSVDGGARLRLRPLTSTTASSS